MPINYTHYHIKLPFMALKYDKEPDTRPIIYPLLIDSDIICKNLYEYFQEDNNIVESVVKHNKNHKFIMDEFKANILNSKYANVIYDLEKIFQKHQNIETEKLIRTIIPFMPYEVCIEIKLRYNNMGDYCDYSIEWDYEVIHIDCISDLRAIKNYPKIESFGWHHINYFAIIKEYSEFK